MALSHTMAGEYSRTNLTTMASIDQKFSEKHLSKILQKKNYFNKPELIGFRNHFANIYLLNIKSNFKPTRVIRSFTFSLLKD